MGLCVDQDTIDSFIRIQEELSNIRGRKVKDDEFVNLLLEQFTAYGYPECQTTRISLVPRHQITTPPTPPDHTLHTHHY